MAKKVKVKIFQNRSNTSFEANGRQYTTGEVIQRLFIIELYTNLVIYRYGEANGKSSTFYYKLTIGWHTN